MPMAKLHAKDCMLGGGVPHGIEHSEQGSVQRDRVDAESNRQLKVISIN